MEHATVEATTRAMNFHPVVASILLVVAILVFGFFWLVFRRQQ